MHAAGTSFSKGQERRSRTMISSASRLSTAASSSLRIAGAYGDPSSTRQSCNSSPTPPRYELGPQRPCADQTIPAHSRPARGGGECNGGGVGGGRDRRESRRRGDQRERTARAPRAKSCNSSLAEKREGCAHCSLWEHSALPQRLALATAGSPGKRCRSDGRLPRHGRAFLTGGAIASRRHRSCKACGGRR